ncbi:hypothetical protein ACFOLJ_31035 [Rugamonas sp. CCM 8940]|uniref:hypothetical protein n=1 Tax=Rugamonas sp. CCM 8940 TaxID=2765359 RepID=UPI0018F29176|nr:hypothetical protein [Rugamonas sp. CCM 8940]MBJ7309211.1 hypothetical protein [Rugamonas sp. CCM 8940]
MAAGADGSFYVGGWRQGAVARLDGGRMSLRSVVAGLNDASSVVVVGNRVYFIESEYRLLPDHQDDDSAVPRGVPFDLQSRELPADE